MATATVGTDSPRGFVVGRASIALVTSTPASRNLRARVAAHSSWAVTPDRAARTAPARAAFMKKFEDQVDPDRVLSEKDRAARAESARHAHYLRLALKSANARRAKRERKASAGANN